MNPERKISVYHFVYFFVIFVIAIIAILAMQFGGSGRAGENLNFGATLASIILAVIAILYTLFDSSSQKKNAAEIKKSVKQLKGFGEEIRTQIDEFRQSNINLLNKLVELEEWRKHVMDEIQTSTSDVQNADEVKKQVNEILNRRVNTQPDEAIYLDDSVILNIMSKNMNKKYWLVEDIYIVMVREYRLNIEIGKVMDKLEKLADKGFIKKSRNNGRVVFSMAD